MKTSNLLVGLSIIGAGLLFACSKTEQPQAIPVVPAASTPSTITDGQLDEAVTEFYRAQHSKTSSNLNSTIVINPTHECYPSYPGDSQSCARFLCDTKLDHFAC